MTSLDLAQVLKDEQARLSTVISVATRRRAILQHSATSLRLGVSQAVVLAELEAAGEPIDLTGQED